MAKGINKVILVGNLGQDPETRTFPNGGQVTNISVATSESWLDKQTGQRQERTEWNRVVFNGRLAEIASQYLAKGSKVYIEGSLRTRKWQDKQTGENRYSTDVYAREMQMLDSRPQGEPTTAPPMPTQATPQPSANYQGGMQQNNQNLQSAPQQPAPSFDAFEDDIPF